MNAHITRVESAADTLTIRDLALAAFPTDLEANLIDKLRADPAWIEGLSVLSVDERGATRGYALLTRCHIGDHPALLLGPVAAWPAHQNSGYGSAAIRGALNQARLLGEHHIVVVGHPSYYPRFGFERASEHGITTSDGAPDEAVMALTLEPAHPLPSGVVSYADPFTN